MAEFLGTVRLGGLYCNGSVLYRPSMPWRNNVKFPGVGYGNIHYYTHSPQMSSWTIGNTPSEEGQQLLWQKIKDGEKTLYICDRNILYGVSWFDLNSLGYTTGTPIVIDGRLFLCRLITGGKNLRQSLGGNYNGGAPIDNEWDRFIMNESNVAGLPVPASYDLDNVKNSTPYYGPHHQAWHWYNTLTICQETSYIYSDGAHRTTRGGSTARYINCMYLLDGAGWRPVLEEINSPPTISDTDRDLGERNSNFQISYYVNDPDASNTLTTTEYIDGQLQRSFSAARNQNYTIDIPVKNLALGAHSVSVNVTDGYAAAARTWTFRRINTAPVISGSDGSLGDKNVGFSYQYSVNDADLDAVTVIERLNQENLRVLSNVPLGQTQTLTIDNAKLYALPIGAVHTLQIEVNDLKGGIAYRTLTFRRTNTAPVISGSDKDLGIKDNAFSESYVITDLENDSVQVAEYLDNQVIRSFTATLGKTEHISVDKNTWLQLANGQHTLKIEAADSQGSKTIRVINFSKNETVIDLYPFSEPIRTDVRAKKILFTPTWVTAGSAQFHIFACNNAFDSNPTWEEITAQVLINRVYNFTNMAKTAGSWGIDIRIYMEKSSGYGGIISVNSYGGAFE